MFLWGAISETWGGLKRNSKRRGKVKQRGLAVGGGVLLADGRCSWNLPKPLLLAIRKQ